MLSDFGRRLPENKIMCLKLRSLNLFALGTTYSGLPEAPNKALLFNKILIVHLLLFTKLIVVLLLLLTIRTMFKA